MALLKGLKIVDLTSVVFGPYATQILSDLGAEVIKVEAPGGDMFRSSARAAVTPGMSPGFMAINRGKTSVELDLKTSPDLAVMQGLLREADVFVLNVRGKGAERLGLDYASVAKLNPGIIYAHCVGFGQDGPYADLQAYDDVIQAASGTSSIPSRVDGNPRARYIPSLIADKVAGLHAVYAVLAAVIHRMRTGRGQHIEIPMLEAFSSFMLLEHLDGLTFDPPVGDACYQRQIEPARQPFPTKDGYISIVAYTDSTWPKLFSILGCADLLGREEFSTPKLRARNVGALYQAIADHSPAFDSQTLLAACHAAQIPAQIARDISDILDDPHLKQTGFFRRRTHPSEGDYYEMQPPVKFGDADTTPDRMPPRIGEHSEEVRGRFASRMP